MKPRTALLSVYHKEGIAEFARGLAALGWRILASGGTAKTIKEAGVPVQDSGELSGAPILGHRVVTLSREIHAGLLARDLPEDEAELARLGIPRIDLVCVDLYPLAQAIAAKDAARASVIEMTDVGGPTLLHSAAKGERIVVCDPADRARVLAWLKDGSPDAQAFTDALAAKADALVAEYCLASAHYRGQGTIDGQIGELVQTCKYGENAWQTPAALFRADGDDPLAIANFRAAAGEAPSYNNLCDLDRMLQTITHIAAAFDVNRKTVPLIAVGVKHGNACGAAVGENPIEVIGKMVSGDTRAIFGGLLMLTFPVDAPAAEALLHASMPENARRLLDGIAAPSFTPEAKELLNRKGGRCRLMENPALARLGRESLDTGTRRRPVRGGFLSQPNYTYVLDLHDPSAALDGALTSAQESDMLIAWAVASTSNSNTITLVKGGQLIGNGVGQQDRVGCCELAIKRAKDAGHDVRGAVAASDSFFPFPDGPETLAKAGIAAILATSGSVKDAEVAAACAKSGVTFVTVPDAIGRGFYNH